MLIEDVAERDVKSPRGVALTGVFQLLFWACFLVALSVFLVRTGETMLDAVWLAIRLTVMSFCLALVALVAQRIP